MSAPDPAEARRLAALCALDLLDTPPEERFDRITRVVRAYYDVPLAFVSLIDADRLWFKSRQGFDNAQGPRAGSLCDHALRAGGLFVAEDTAADPALAHALVRFYAAQPLAGPGGAIVGMLAIADFAPRAFGEADRAALADFGAIAARELNASADGRKRETDFERLFALSVDQMVIATLDGRYVRVNPAYTRQLGWEAHEIEGRSLFEHMHPDDHARTAAEVGTLAAGATTFSFENRYVTKDGGVRWLRWTAVPVPAEGRMYAVARDITEARAIAAESQRRKAFLEGLIENLPMAVVYLDADLVCRVANPAYGRFMGMPGEAFVGRPLLDVLPGTEPRIEALMRRVIETGEPYQATAFPFTFTGPDGAVRETWWDFVYHAMPGGLEGETGLLIMANEVSARVAQERAEARLRAERIEALEAANAHKEQFLGILSHELRTPLNAILGFGSILEDGIAGPLNDEQGGFAARILRAADAMLGLVDDMLDMSRIQAGKFAIDPAPMDLAEAARAAMGELALTARANEVDLVDALGDAPLAVVGDVRRVRQIVANLVGNALKFTPADGAVTVSAARDGDRLRVAIADTGIGIPPDQQARIFQPFTQVDMSSTRVRGGVGLGLAIVRVLVEAHGGEVGVESAPGAGSTFWFTLPLA